MAEIQAFATLAGLFKHGSATIALSAVVAANVIVVYGVLDKVIFKGICVSRAISGAEHPEGKSNIGVSIVAGMALSAAVLGSFVLAAFNPSWLFD